MVWIHCRRGFCSDGGFCAQLFPPHFEAKTQGGFENELGISTATERTQWPGRCLQQWLLLTPSRSDSFRLGGDAGCIYAMVGIYRTALCLRTCRCNAHPIKACAQETPDPIPILSFCPSPVKGLYSALIAPTTCHSLYFVSVHSCGDCNLCAARMHTAESRTRQLAGL